MSRKKKADSLPLGVVKQVKLMAAFHAAGRFIAAKHFKVAKGSSLRPIGNGALFADETIYSPTSAFNEAIIGRSGALAEMVFVIKSIQWKGTCKTVWEMFAEHQLSKNDSDLITHHKERCKTFNAAVKIIEDNSAELKQAGRCYGWSYGEPEKFITVFQIPPVTDAQRRGRSWRVVSNKETEERWKSMKILATVKIKESQITQAWELIEDKDDSVLVINLLNNGDVVGLVLDNDKIEDLRGSEIAEKKYFGNLDISNAELVPRAG